MSPTESAPAWRRGLVRQVDPARHRVKVELPDEDHLLTDWLPVITRLSMGARSSVLPRVGSQVVVLLDEFGEDGVVLGGIFSATDPAPGGDALLIRLDLEDGSVITLDPTQGVMTVDTPGRLVARAGGDVQVVTQANATLTATGNVDVQATKIQLKATVEITLDAPVVKATQVLQAQGVIQANGGISTTSGGSIPGALKVAGQVQSDSGITAPDATLGGKSFLGHQHQAQGAIAPTTPPL